MTTCGWRVRLPIIAARAVVGGPVIVPESAEFYVRLFRALQLTQDEVNSLTAEELTSLTALAARSRKLDAPPEGGNSPLN